jgi:hypothetical protein
VSFYDISIDQVSASERGYVAYRGTEGLLPSALPRQQQENDKENCRRAARDATEPSQTGYDCYNANRTAEEEEST